MFDTCILHIGSGKTGTSSIQRTFYQEADKLAHHSLCVPRIMEHGNHWFLPAKFADPIERFPVNILHGLNRKESIALNEKHFGMLLCEVERSTASQLLMSSEYLAIMKLDKIYELRDFLASLAREIEIYCYVRDPVSYATSVVQQTVKTGQKRLAEIIDTPSRFGARKCIENWVKVFGKERIHIQAFEDIQLVGQDVVLDFICRLGIAEALDATDVKRINNSLSQAAVEMADRYWSEPQNTGSKGIPNSLSAIPGPKFTLPPASAERVRKQSRGDVDYLSNEWGIHFEKMG